MRLIMPLVALGLVLFLLTVLLVPESVVLMVLVSPQASATLEFTYDGRHPVMEDKF